MADDCAPDAPTSRIIERRNRVVVRLSELTPDERRPFVNALAKVLLRSVLAELDAESDDESSEGRAL